jgi:hypothetical protein
MEFKRKIKLEDVLVYQLYVAQFGTAKKIFLTSRRTLIFCRFFDGLGTG